MLEVTLPSAFLAGILTFLAPCTLPLVPAYLAFLAGSKKTNESVVFKRALFFILGFSSIIILMGLFVSQIGQFIVQYRSVLVMIGGLLFIIFGASLLNFFRIPINMSGMPTSMKPDSNLAAFGLGIVFAFGWSPCIGPILGSIYVLAAGSGSVFYGGLLLIAYAIGHGIPFLIFAYFYDKSFKMVSKLSAYTEKLNKVAGVILIVIGLFMLFGKYAVLVGFFKEFMSGGWQNSLMNYL
jgi:cytochrome c-type biogenesis protein